MSSFQTVRMAEAISPDLMFRGIANSFFNRLERTKADCFMLDFTDIRSISRSFAHQYILRKKASRKKITEVNMPNNVFKMLNIVERSCSANASKFERTDLSQIKVITV